MSIYPTMNRHKINRHALRVIPLAFVLSLFSLTGSGRSNLAALEQPQADPFCGMEFVPGDDLATVRSMGVNVVLQTFRHDGDLAEWLAQLDLVHGHGMQVIGQLWPEGWKWDGAAWQIDDQAQRFVQTLATHPATLAVYVLHEPYWRGCRTCGLTTAQQQALYQELKAIAEVPLYSEIGDITAWANRGQATALADGVCDYCGATYYPFFADGTYHRDEFISHLDQDLATIRESAPNSRLVWGMQVFAQSNSPRPRRMPTVEEMIDIGAIVAERDVEGIFWYVWEFGSLYDDFLSNHPELFPAVAAMPFCADRLSTPTPATATALPAKTPATLTVATAMFPSPTTSLLTEPTRSPASTPTPVGTTSIPTPATATALPAKTSDTLTVATAMFPSPTAFLLIEPTRSPAPTPTPVGTTQHQTAPYRNLCGWATLVGFLSLIGVAAFVYLRQKGKV